MQAGNRKIEVVPGEGAVKGEAYMRDDFIDRKIRKMAEAERMAVPESLDAKWKYFGRTGNREEGQQKHGWKESECKRYAIMALDES